MVKIERVRKSSGGTEDAVNVEIDRAADRSARRDAVRLDLNTDLNGKDAVLCLLSEVGVTGLNTLKSS
jgi:hypothetical protein